MLNGMHWCAWCGDDCAGVSQKGVRRMMWPMKCGWQHKTRAKLALKEVEPAEWAQKFFAVYEIEWGGMSPEKGVKNVQLGVHKRQRMTDKLKRSGLLKVSMNGIGRANPKGVMRMVCWSPNRTKENEWSGKAVNRMDSFRLEWKNGVRSPLDRGSCLEWKRKRPNGWALSKRS